MKKQLLWCVMCVMAGSSPVYAQHTKAGDVRDEAQDTGKETSLRVMTPDGEWVTIEHHSSANSRRDVAKSLCETRKGFQVPHLVAVSYTDEDGKEIVLECPAGE